MLVLVEAISLILAESEAEALFDASTALSFCEMDFEILVKAEALVDAAALKDSLATLS